MRHSPTRLIPLDLHTLHFTEAQLLFFFHFGRRIFMDDGDRLRGVGYSFYFFSVILYTLMFSHLHLQLHVVNARVGRSYAPSITKINPPAHPRRLQFPSIFPAPTPSVTPLAFPLWPSDSGRTQATEGSCSGNHPYVSRSTRSSRSSVAVTSTPSSRRAWAWAPGPPRYFVLFLSHQH